MPDFPDDVVERVARAISKAEGLDWDEVCGLEAGKDECESITCISAFHEDHEPELARRHTRKLAKAAIAAIAAAWEWVKAEDAPVEWEGREVWIYEPWTIAKIRKGILPFSYSRLPSHCAGAMVMLSITPPPPEARDDD